MQKRYEYKMFQLEPPYGGPNLETQLNGLGSLGWELVWSDFPSGTILMGREVPGVPAPDAPEAPPGA